MSSWHPWLVPFWQLRSVIYNTTLSMTNKSMFFKTKIKSNWSQTLVTRNTQVTKSWSAKSPPTDYRHRQTSYIGNVGCCSVLHSAKPSPYYHTKQKVVNELSKSSHYWPLLGCQGCHSDGAFFNNPESKTRTKDCHHDNPKVVTGLSLRQLQGC